MPERLRTPFFRTSFRIGVNPQPGAVVPLRLPDKRAIDRFGRSVDRLQPGIGPVLTTDLGARPSFHQDDIGREVELAPE